MNVIRAYRAAKNLCEDGCPDACNYNLELLPPHLQQEIKSMSVNTVSVPGVGRVSLNNHIPGSTPAPAAVSALKFRTPMAERCAAAAGGMPPKPAAPAANPEESTSVSTKTAEKPKEKLARKTGPAASPPTVESPSTAPDKPAESASKIKASTAKSRREPGSRPAAKAGAETPKKPDLKATTAGSGPKPKKESKTELVDRLLCAKVGVTKAKLSEATGWPSVNLRVAAGRRPDHILIQSGDRFRLILKGDAIPAEWEKVKL